LAGESRYVGVWVSEASPIIPCGRPLLVPAGQGSAFSLEKNMLPFFFDKN
jgi:hypothetical protein